VAKPVDAAGRSFFDWNPGRYNGGSVLAPTPDGFADFGTLPLSSPPADGISYGVRFYFAEVVDSDGDGVYEIQQSGTDCYRDCAGGTIWTTIYAWNGTDFAAVVPASPEDCGAIGFEINSDNVASDIRATGVICDDARELVTTVGKTHNFYSGPRSFTSGSYACSVVTEGEFPVGHYNCQDGPATVTWKKT